MHGVWTLSKGIWEEFPMRCLGASALQQAPSLGLIEHTVRALLKFASCGSGLLSPPPDVQHDMAELRSCIVDLA